MGKTQIRMIGIFCLVGIGLYMLYGAAANTPTPVPPKHGSSAQPTQPSAIKPTSLPQQSPRVNSSQQNTPLTRQEVTAAAAERAPRQIVLRQTVTKEHTYRVNALPNDPYATNNWVFTSTRAPAAWDTQTGGPITVAVIDTGFALAHEDLVTQWAINPRETGMTANSDRCWTGASLDKQKNNCDDDGNGYVDDWRGWDFWQIDNSPQAGSELPTGEAVSHGTSTAGLIGAASNNGKGSASLNWAVRVMPLQAMADDGIGYTSDIIAAIYYAVDNGAAIINMSLGGSEPDTALTQAIQYAYTHNVLVIASAGNCGTGAEEGCDPSKPGAMGWPALDEHVISVGAIDSGLSRASFSSYGPALDIVAPGSGAIIAPVWTPSNQTSLYSRSLYGTSFSAPIVASLASLIRSVRPIGSITDSTALIDATAQKVVSMNGKLYSNEYGHGLIDADQALRVALALNSSSAGSLLRQTGSHISEHTFYDTTLLSSGCLSAPSNYCTIRAANYALKTERYLPYSLANTSGDTGWSWPGSNLTAGEWYLNAQHGNQLSPQTYFLFHK